MRGGISCRRHVPWEQSPQDRPMGAPKQILLPCQFSTGKPRALQGPGMFSLCLASQHHPRHRTRSPDPTCRIPRPQEKFEAARSGAWLAALAPLPSVHPRAFSPTAQSPSESRILGDYLSLCSRLLLQNTIDCAAYKPHVYFSRFWRLKPQHRVPTCSGSGEGLLQAGGQRTSRLSSSGSSTKELSQPLS